MLEYIVLVAAFASLAAALVYIRSMFKGQTKPNRVTWFMWSVAPFIATGASVSSGVGWAVVPVFISGLSPFLIFTLLFSIREHIGNFHHLIICAEYCQEQRSFFGI